MKRLILTAVAGMVVGAGMAGGQTTGVGGGGTGAGIGAKLTPVKPETTVTVKLGALRKWKNLEGTEIAAELIAWPLTDPKAATADPATLKFDVVRQGQIRLRKDGKVFLLPLAKLSESDRAYVANIEAATRKPAPKHP